MPESSILEDFTHPAATAERLLGRGLGNAVAPGKADLFARCARTLRESGLSARADARAFFVPGRIEVLGKHTDYAGGSSLLAACERGFCLIVMPGADARIQALAVDLDDRAAFDIGPDLEAAPGHWSNYPRTVARRIARNFAGSSLRGGVIAFAGDLPFAAGMSGSSAILTGWFLALSAINALPERPEYAEHIPDRVSLAGYLGTVENGQTFRGLAGDRGVGTFGGSEDHTALLCCRPDGLVQYAYCPVRFERQLAMPRDLVFAVAASGVVAEKTREARDRYNRASHLAAAVAGAWRAATGDDAPHLAAVLRDPDRATTVERMRSILSRTVEGSSCSPDTLIHRFEHFLVENEEILPAAVAALAAGDLVTFGREVDRSQALAETRLGNQVPETIHLARSAREEGAAAASAFGAGFGGSVWALVKRDAADDFLVRWRTRYAEAFPSAAAKASFFTTRPGPSAFEVGASMP